MKARNDAGSGFLRPILLPVFKYFYRHLGLSGRNRLRKVPGGAALFQAVTKKFLLAERSEEGLVVANVHGFRIYADPREASGGFLLGEYEPATTSVFKGLLGHDDVVVDVGANLGYFTLLAATLCGAGGRVFAFEPHPQNFDLLTKNIRANGLANAQAIQKAVSNHTGKSELQLSVWTGSHSLRFVPDGWKMSPGRADHIVVDTITLDDFFADNPTAVDLVKMDIEGAEPAAVAGMKGLIERNPDLVIITEFLPHYLGEPAEDFLNQLMSLGFELTVIDDEQYRLRVGWSKAQVLDWAMRTALRHLPTNLLWTHGKDSVRDLVDRWSSRNRTLPRIMGV